MEASTPLQSSVPDFPPLIPPTFSHGEPSLPNHHFLDRVAPLSVALPLWALGPGGLG